MKPFSSLELSSFCGQIALILKAGISSLEGLMIMQEDAASPGPLDQLLKKEQSGELMRAVQGLDVKYRTIVLLYYYNELGIREIAQILDINEKTVSGRLATARDRMEKQYAKEKPPAVIYKLTGKNMKQKEMYYDKA